MSGSGSKSTTTQVAEPATSSTGTSATGPWQPTQAANQQIISDATALYGSGVGSQPYLGNMVIPYAQQTTQGMKTQESLANAAQPIFNDAAAQVAETTQRGMDPWSTESVERLRSMANGDMLQNNPYLNDLISRSAADITGAQKMAASGAGRMGSGGYQAVTDKAVGDMASKLRVDDYARERGYQQDAIGSVYNAGLQKYANEVAAPGQLQAAYNASMAPSETLMGVGAMHEDLATRMKNEEVRQWEARQNQGWNQLARLQSIIGPISGYGQTGQTNGYNSGGTSTTTATAPQASRFQSILGGALSGSTYGLPGAAAGGLLGAFS